MILICLFCSCQSTDSNEIQKYTITGVELLDTFENNRQSITVFPSENVRIYVYKIKLSGDDRDTILIFETRNRNMSTFIGESIKLKRN